jgi:hypothetical protein
VPGLASIESLANLAAAANPAGNPFDALDTALNPLLNPSLNPSLNPLPGTVATNALVATMLAANDGQATAHQA